MRLVPLPRLRPLPPHRVGQLPLCFLLPALLALLAGGTAGSTGATTAASPLRIAPPWHPGVADTTLGRFGTWPEFDASDDNKYEGNLIGRVHPDWMVRTVAGNPFGVAFGARDEGEDPGPPQVSILERNWVFKKILVERGNCSYRLAYNTLSPGILLSTEEAGFTLAPDEPLGYFAYRDSSGTRTVDFSAPGIGEIYYNRESDGDWSENWLLTWLADGPALGVQVPLLLAFSNQPRFIQWSHGELFVRFDKESGATTDIFCVPLDGVAPRSLGEVAAWSDSLPAAISDLCRERSRRLLPFLSSCSETFRIDTAANTVTIHDLFGSEPWSDDWGTPLSGAAPYPPLLYYASTQGYPVDFQPRPVDFGMPTKQGPYASCPGQTEVEYSIPLAPLWNLNLVPTTRRSPWFDRTSRQVELWATDLVWDLTHSVTGWSLSTAHGLFEALPVVDPASRRLYLKRCEQVLDRVLFDFSPEGVWKQRQVPGTNITYDYLLSQDSYPEQPLDPDCGSGAPLEFIAHYALHSGDWDRIIAAEAEIARIFHYLEVVSDWAWMAGSARDYGAGGAFLDMFPSQWMGYVACARIGRVLATAGVPGWEERSAYAWYLASKGMVPLTQRLGFAERFGSDYWEFAADQVCTGFGEYEPNPDPAIPGFHCYAPTGSMVNYNAKLISGESFHPLVNEVYGRFVPADFAAVMQLGFSVNNGLNFNLNRDDWPFVKVYAFESVGWDAAEVDSMWHDLHRAEDLDRRLLGPPTLSRHGFMYAQQALRDLPVRAIGAWEPALLSGARFDRGRAELLLELDNRAGLADSIDLVLRVTEPPIAVQVDGEPAATAYDPAWGTLRLTLPGIEVHRVRAAFAPARPGAVAAQAHSISGPWRAPDANRVMNGGFEDCGDHPNWLHPWTVYKLLPANYPKLSGHVVHSGDYAMLLHNPSAADSTAIFQTLYVGPHSGYTVSFWYNIPTALSGDGAFTVACQEYDDANPPRQAWRTLTIPDFHNPTAGWEYVEIPLETLPSFPECVIVRLHFRLKYLQNSVYIDDIELRPQPD